MTNHLLRRPLRLRRPLLQRRSRRPSPPHRPRRPLRRKDGKREVKVLASGLYRPNGVAFHNGTLYIAELSKISKIEQVEDVLDNPPKPTVIYDNLPKDEAHGWKFIAIGPDNKLYIPVGQPGNDELNRVTKVGEDFGAPYCYQGDIPDPEFGWGHSCKDFTPPVGLMGPHAAALVNG